MTKRGKRRSRSRNDAPRKQGIIRLVPLGGLGEIGKNMMFIEYEDGNTHDSLIIDTGIMFPENDMLGIDYIIPDFGYIMDRLDTIRGVVITHGHEDHTGAIAHVMEYVSAPVYATSLTAGLLEVKLKNAGLHNRVDLVTIQAGDGVQMGVFHVEFFHVCHSIPDSVGLGITTPIGLLVHTGDFKFDHTPVDGWPPDFGKLAEFSQRGVLALLSDSTNATVPGWTPSESVIDAAFDQVFSQAPGRILVATFASLISRVQQVVNAARRYGRKIAIMGYSMSENVKMARQLGYLDLPDSMLVDINQALRMPRNEVVLMVTGTQGEPAAVLGRLATGRHRQLEVEPDDTIVMSAHPIPGNEEMVYRTINRLIQRGAEVIYDPIAPVHVSGHAAQEELKLLINLVRPRFFIPVHGELRHLHLHSKIAMQLGIPPENIAVVENGTVLTLTADSLTVGERVPGGYVFVDGSGVGDIGPEVLRDREKLGRDGFVIVNLTLDSETRQLIGEPEIISRGFVYQRAAHELLQGARGTISRVISSNGRTSLRQVRHEVEKQLERFFYNETKRRPMVFAFVTEV
ncbi:MAG TPA: ribonuclease J [Chloroflexi bacterium]|nr:ribonuclease J [Chloroflexota bacterium]